MPVILEEEASAVTIIGKLRTHLRAEGTVGISDAFGYQVMDLTQKMFNARYKRVLTSKDITLDANTLLFDVRTKLTSPEGMTIVAISISDRTLIKLNDWKELFAYDRAWFTKTATRHEVWSPIGADIFVVYPARTVNTTATVVYAGETTTLDDVTDTFDIPDEDVETVYSIAEAILHVHLRNFSEAKKRLADLSTSLGLGYQGSEY